MARDSGGRIPQEVIFTSTPDGFNSLPGSRMYGYGLDVSDDGNFMVVGRPADHSFNLNDVGGVEVRQWVATGALANKTYHGETISAGNVYKLESLPRYQYPNYFDPSHNGTSYIPPGRWSDQTELVANTFELDQYQSWGSSVATNSVGDWIIASAPRASINATDTWKGGTSNGVVRMWQRTSSAPDGGTWTARGQIAGHNWREWFGSWVSGGSWHAVDNDIDSVYQDSELWSTGFQGVDISDNSSAPRVVISIAGRRYNGEDRAGEYEGAGGSVEVFEYDGGTTNSWSRMGGSDARGSVPIDVNYNTRATNDHQARWGACVKISASGAIIVPRPSRCPQSMGA